MRQGSRPNLHGFATSNVGAQAWTTALQHAGSHPAAKLPNTRPVKLAVPPNMRPKLAVLTASRDRLPGEVTPFAVARRVASCPEPASNAAVSQAQSAWVTISNVGVQAWPTARQFLLCPILCVLFVRACYMLCVCVRARACVCVYAGVLCVRAQSVAKLRC